MLANFTKITEKSHITRGMWINLLLLKELLLRKKKILFKLVIFRIANLQF